MYLLYLDESGNENDPNDRYFVLAGLALFERQTYFLAQAFESRSVISPMTSLSRSMQPRFATAGSCGARSLMTSENMS